MSKEKRRCKACGEDKPLDEFAPGAWDPENKAICAEYKKNRMTEIRWCNSCRENFPVFPLTVQVDLSTLESKGKYLIRTYGISLKRYEELFKAQFGTCAICHNPPTKEKPFLVVDHDHKTGKVRGLLCNKCNVAIGLLQDSMKNLHSAARYLNSSHADDLKKEAARMAERPSKR